MSGLTPETLSLTRRLRFTIVFFTLVIFVFQFSAILNSGQWTVGVVNLYNTTNIIVSDSVNSTICGSIDDETDVPEGAVTCTSETYVETGISINLNYGLFRDITYTPSTNVTTTETLTYYNSDGAIQVYDSESQSYTDSLTNTETNLETDSDDVVVQTNYKDWATCNKQWINNVRSTRAFLLISFFCLMISVYLYYMAIYSYRDHSQIHGAIKKGFWWLLISSFSSFVCYLSWIGIPRSAFLYVYADGKLFTPNGGEIYDLQNGLYECRSMENVDTYTSDYKLNRHAFMWQLVFYAWFCCIIVLYIWKRLYTTITRSPYEISQNNSSYDSSYSLEGSDRFDNFNVNNGNIAQNNNPIYQNKNPLNNAQQFHDTKSLTHDINNGATVSI